MMHIITGSARGVRLDTLPGENTRPTSERAKEAIFSMLQFDLAGRRVLDLFAGSGQMALEALSRGAEQAVLVDAARAACTVIEKNAQKTKLASRAKILNADAARFLANYNGEAFHLVFLDPPYAAGLVPSVLSTLYEKGMITPGGTVVAECAGEADLFGGNAELASQYTVLKSKRYGVAHVFVLTPTERNDI